MIDRTTKLRWRRRLRRSKQQVEDISVQAEEHIERHFFKRLNRLLNVRRFVISWILLFGLLAGLVLYQTAGLENYYLSLQPTPGGTLNEGTVGAFTNANPIYAVNNIDISVSKLVFAGLFKYNSKNQLVGDLAQKWQVDKLGTSYKVTLRKNLLWQDGRPLTAKDVIFTYRTIQNPDANSPLLSSWKGIRLSSSNPRSVVFQLPSALSSFPHALTNGIIPKHLLDGVPMTQMRSIAFNTASPVGAGPFRWRAIEVQGDTVEDRVQRIGLLANENYHSGKPNLNGFILNIFRNQEKLIESFKKREINAIAGLTSVPEGLGDQLAIQVHNIPLASEVLVFFKTSKGILKDVNVRRALLLATNTPKITESFEYPVAQASQPLLKGQLGYNARLKQASQNISKAKQLLQKAGWKTGGHNIRSKAGKDLIIKVYSQADSEYAGVTEIIQKQWRAVGVDAQVTLQADADLHTTIGSHDYDALVYGITIGVDPDVYAYWHSSQLDIRSANRLNFSEYKSNSADQALEAGRNRLIASVRREKYRQFLAAWRQDVPAIALYQPRFLYITRGQLFGFKPRILNTGPNRYDNVEDWMINQKKLPK